MRLILLLFSIVLTFQLFGQEKIHLDYKGDSYQQIKRNVTSDFSDSNKLVDYTQAFINLAYKRGYLEASFDSILVEDSLNFTAYFHLGKRYNSIQLATNNDQLLFLRKNGKLNEKLLSNISFTPIELQRTLQSIHKTYTNNGYPFAKVQLRNVQFDSSMSTADLIIEEGPLVIWKELYIQGDSSISKKFISNLIEIKPGEAYKERKLNSISQRIKQLNFIREIKPAEVLFTEEGADLYIYIESVPISSINGVLGLQRDQTTDKLMFTGELKLQLINLLKRGEALNIEWRSIQPQTQALKTKLDFPFLFQTPFGISGKFNLYKKDSTFLELIGNIGVNYFLSGGSYIKAFYETAGSNLLSGSNGQTNLASVNSNNYGLGYFRRRLDYIPNPSVGSIIEFNGSVGSRKSRITDTSNVIQSTIYKSSIDLTFFIPTFNRQTIKISNYTSIYYAPKIYSNELFRIGGLSSIRGFNEEELRASTYSILSVEYRYLVDRNSHAFVFIDQAFYEQNQTNYINDYPFGFGAGFSFGTNIGIFSISYALGKQFDNPILLRDGKIHFGYIAYF